MTGVLRFAAVYCAISAVLFSLILVQEFPWKPSSISGWLALFFLVVPFCAGIELAGAFLLRNRVSQAIENRTAHRKFSWLRVGYFFLVGLVVACVLIFSSQWLSSTVWLQRS
jgi:hypothetical protein